MAKKFNFKEIPMTYVEAADGIIAKFEYRGYYILVKCEKYDDEPDNYTSTVVDKNMNNIDEDFFPTEGYGLEDVRDDAADYIDDLLDKPKQAREKLKECDTAKLQNIFYTYAISAPSWADEVMGLVAERKLRQWLIDKINDMLTDEEIIDEMGM